MTDERLAKVLALCSARECGECPLLDNGIPDEDTCRRELIRIAGDVIERQNTEIERLNSNLKFVRGTITRTKSYIETLDEKINKCRTEAIKVFAERLKEKSHNYYPSIDSYCTSRHVVLTSDIDNLVEEMTEEKDNA